MRSSLFENVVGIVKSQFPGQSFIPLHVPVFKGREREYLMDTIDSTFVSSVGTYVNRFEEMMGAITGARYAIAIVNGTNALHLSLLLAGVEAGDEVLSQSLTFIATCNAISYLKARPVFIDVDRDTMGMSPSALAAFLAQHAEQRDGGTYNKTTGRRIRACVPMHTFGLPCRIDEIAAICNQYGIVLIEDAAESIGSYYKGRHTGTFGAMGTFSFNGNKTVTCGGGGALVTNDPALAKKAKHLSTQAKVAHPWAFMHDDIGYNYRMPNLNAALACAQLEQLDTFIDSKRALTAAYTQAFGALHLSMAQEIEGAKANYWLNAILLDNREERDAFLAYANNNGVMARPMWDLMHTLPMFAQSPCGPLENSMWLSERVVNIPSSARL